jgi:hypothetical protein
MSASLPQTVEAGDYMADQVQTIVKGNGGSIQTDYPGSPFL